MIRDSFGRVHDYLRISITDNCNLRCFYCMPKEDYEFTPSFKLMQTQEIEAIAKIFVELGIKKIRLTGGEPLLRKDAPDIIKGLSLLPIELSLTTNATRLHVLEKVLDLSSIRTLNISLDTLQSERFKNMTSRDQFNLTLKNINLFIQKGYSVKINMVVIKDLNEDEIWDFVEWTRYKPIQVRFIEFMPFDGNRWTSNKVFTLKEILALIQKKYSIIPLQNHPHDTAKNYSIEGHRGNFAIISTMSAPFCTGCNRLRLTADGKIKNCLFSKNEIDLLNAFRSGKDIKSLIFDNVIRKEKELGGQFSSEFEKIQSQEIHNRSMISIGG